MLGLTEQYSSRAISGHVIKGNHLPCDAGPEPTATRTAAAVANSAVALGQSCSAMIVPARLNPSLHLQRDQERARAEHEPTADLTQRRNANAVSGDELVEPYQPHAPSWYEPEPCEERRAPHARHGAGRGAKVGAVQERYECEDQERIDRPDLGGEPFHTEEPSVQLLCLPVEAIRGHQKPSEAIRSHQRPSEAIREAIREAHQRSSEAIRGNQRPSEALRDAHMHAMREAIRGHQGPSETLTCSTHAEPLWSYKLQYTAKKPNKPISLHSARAPSGLQVLRRKRLAFGGTCVYLRRRYGNQHAIRGHQRSSEVCTCDGRSRRRALREPWRCLCVGEGAVVSTTTSSTLKCKRVQSSATTWHAKGRMRARVLEKVGCE